jgi:hypothetical protein
VPDLRAGPGVRNPNPLLLIGILDEAVSVMMESIGTIANGRLTAYILRGKRGIEIDFHTLLYTSISLPIPLASL